MAYAIKKTCTKCGIERPIVEFNRNGKRGRIPRCRICRSATRRANPNAPYRLHKLDHNASNRICYVCSIPKPIEDFRFCDKTYTNREGTCRMCANIQASKSRIKNRNKIRARSKTTAYKKRSRKYELERKKLNPAYKLRASISSNVRRMLRLQRTYKTNSITKHIPYTLQQLKEHLEKQFEPWMNWDNHGAYHIDKWKDDDQSTWTWQMDHIIPHSELPYTNMEDENFRKCWALENLRPLSAKQNVLDGVHRTRHNQTRDQLQVVQACIDV
jgi:hypothetical protein